MKKAKLVLLLFLCLAGCAKPEDSKKEVFLITKEKEMRLEEAEAEKLLSLYDGLQYLVEMQESPDDLIGYRNFFPFAFSVKEGKREQRITGDLIFYLSDGSAFYYIAASEEFFAYAAKLVMKYDPSAFGFGRAFLDSLKEETMATSAGYGYTIWADYLTCGQKDVKSLVSSIAEAEDLELTVPEARLVKDLFPEGQDRVSVNGLVYKKLVSFSKDEQLITVSSEKNLAERKDLLERFRREQEGNEIRLELWKRDEELSFGGPQIFLSEEEAQTFHDLYQKVSPVEFEGEHSSTYAQFFGRLWVKGVPEMVHTDLYSTLNNKQADCFHELFDFLYGLLEKYDGEMFETAVKERGYYPEKITEIRGTSAGKTLWRNYFMPAETLLSDLNAYLENAENKSPFEGMSGTVEEFYQSLDSSERTRENEKVKIKLVFEDGKRKTFALKVK